jgi:5-oxoprolinase (ATP-hydrolysing) subunit A
MAVSLNIDLGELDDEPEELSSVATMINVACGGHAGDEATMERTVRRALASGARIAAHPSYPDRNGFGRTSLAIEPPALAASIAAQIMALAEVARRAGARIEAVKPHGALYHDVARDPILAEAMLTAMTEALAAPFALVGPPEGALARLAMERSFVYLREGFADRAYGADGRLVPRTSPGALLTEAAAASAQAVRLAATGHYETLCVHGDTPGAVEIARAVRRELEAAGLLEAKTK